jgi:hypothetical protein
MAATVTRPERYAEAVKLDRAAMKVRNELRKARPNQAVIRAELHRARKAMERI